MNPPPPFHFAAKYFVFINYFIMGETRNKIIIRGEVVFRLGQRAGGEKLLLAGGMQQACLLASVQVQVRFPR